MSAPGTPTTVEYELEEPFSELLPNLTMFQATILNADNVKALGRDFGVKGFDGTGPYCWTSWEPRNQTVLTRRAEYKWGPPFYANRGTGEVREDRHQDRAGRGGAACGDGLRADGPDDARWPDQYLPQIAKMPTLSILHPERGDADILSRLQDIA